MNAPMASTITLVAELIIASIVFFIIYAGYAKNAFPPRVAVFAIIYEVVFNVGYMLYRTLAHTNAYTLSPIMKMIAALHGMLSLAMLIVVVLFFLNAKKQYASGENYFFVNKFKTLLFIFFWLLSLSSGIFLYISVYK